MFKTAIIAALVGAGALVGTGVASAGPDIPPEATTEQIANYPGSQNLIGRWWLDNPDTTNFNETNTPRINLSNAQSETFVGLVRGLPDITVAGVTWRPSVTGQNWDATKAKDPGGCVTLYVAPSTYNDPAAGPGMRVLNTGWYDYACK